MDPLHTVHTSLHEFILNDHFYIDKANLLVDFINFMDTSPKLYAPNFYKMIRPRGFGLSLTMETIEALLVRDDLISQGIIARELDLNLPQKPVIRISLKKVTYNNPNEFKNALLELLQMQFWKHHINFKINPLHNPKFCFSELIKQVAQKSQNEVVVLIDNYDIPFIIASAMNKAYQDEALGIYLDMLNSIKYSNAVSFCLLGGHINFSLASQISEGIPFVQDLSYDSKFSKLFGFTKQELIECYGDILEKLAPRQGLTKNEYIYALEQIYGGHRFCDEEENLICPLCINSAIDNDGILYPYTASGDYSFLINAIKAKNINLSWIIDKDGQDALFYNNISLNPKDKELGAILLQLGFLNIKKVTLSDGDYPIWRYKFGITNYQMQRILDVFLGKCDSSVLKMPFNPQIFDDIQSNELI